MDEERDTKAPTEVVWPVSVEAPPLNVIPA